MAVEELKRIKTLGLVAGLVPLFVADEVGYWSRRYDSLWATAVELDMPVGFHAFTSRVGNQTSDKVPLYDAIPNRFREPQRVIAGMILSGIFDRFPELRLVSAENDAGWAGVLLQQLDLYFERQRHRRDDIQCKEKPSDIFRRNVFLTFMRDRTAILARDVTGSENILWGSDYPHGNATWPDSTAILSEHFEGSAATETEILQIVRDNARRLYGFELPAAATAHIPVLADISAVR